MDEHPPVPDYLCAWFLTQEDYDAMINGVVDSREAWLHFEPLWTSLGYSICYGTLNDSKLHMPLVDQAEAGDPFHPTPTGLFVHLLPDKLDQSIFHKRAAGWKMTSSRVTFAYDKLNHLVVIKALESSKASSELDVFSYLNSPALRSSPQNHTIPVLAQAEAEGWHFLIMPAWNMGCAPYSMWQVDDYFEKVIQSFEGLTFMHAHGIAHRDISISNLVFNQDGTVPIVDLWIPQPVISTWDVRLAFIDFGISKRFSLETDSSTWVTSECSGTPTYMAPEVASTEDSPAYYQVLPADVYALARVCQWRIDWEKNAVESCKTMPHMKNYEAPVYTCQVLEKCVPQFMQLLGEMLDADPTRRPTAADALSRFEAMRQTVPDHIRFAPAEGYSKDFI